LLDAQSFAGAMLTNYFFVFCVIAASAAFSRAVATTYLIGTLAAVSAVMHFSQLQPPPLLWIVQLGAIAGTGIAIGYFIRWLKWYATTDDLTGVATRRAFDQVLDSYLRAARPGESPVSLAMIDLDNFKVVNDTEGHPEGDRLLRDVVDECRRARRRARSAQPVRVVRGRGGGSCGRHRGDARRSRGCRVLPGQAETLGHPDGRCCRPRPSGRRRAGRVATGSSTPSSR
jgi:GGDEF domain-containing protein